MEKVKKVLNQNTSSFLALIIQWSCVVWLGENVTFFLTGAFQNNF